jgi:hypothetical protein
VLYSRPQIAVNAKWGGIPPNSSSSSHNVILMLVEIKGHVNLRLLHRMLFKATRVRRPLN